MTNWQGALALLALAWTLQCAGTLVQIRRYRAAFRELSTEWTDGWMGVGKAGGGLRAGAIAMLLVAPDETVRRVVTIAGRTVFARAERHGAFERISVAELRANAAAAPKDVVLRAVLAALDQIHATRFGPGGRDVPAGRTVPAVA